MSSEFDAEVATDQISQEDAAKEKSTLGLRFDRSTKAGVGCVIKNSWSIINGKPELNPDSVKANSFNFAGTQLSLDASSKSDIAWMAFDDAKAWSSTFRTGL